MKRVIVTLITTIMLGGLAAAQDAEWAACESVTRYATLEYQLMTLRGAPPFIVTLVMSARFTPGDQFNISAEFVRRGIRSTAFQYVGSGSFGRLRSGTADYLAATNAVGRGWFVFWQSGGGVACLLEVLEVAPEDPAVPLLRTPRG